MKTKPPGLRAALVAFVAGILFAAGLILGGMTQPGKVISFLDVTGRWDPSLIFVMSGAIFVYLPTYWLSRQRKAPLFASHFQLPSTSVIDGKLVVGSILFGVGWGIVGFCPGPALTAAGAIAEGALPFVGAMLCGMLSHWVILGRKTSSDEKVGLDRMQNTSTRHR